MIRAVYVAGWGRSGTTILDKILGQLPGFVSVGELRSLWDLQQPETWMCSCGEPIPSCPLWGPATSDSLEEIGLHGLTDARRLRERETRTRHLLRLWRTSRNPRPGASGSRYLALLLATYSSVLDRAEAGVVVDSSKHPSEAFLLSSTTDVDLRVIHLIRDPRASAYSWGQRKDEAGRQGALMPRYGPVFSSVRWTVWNVAIEALLGPRLGDRYLRVCYEDLMGRPKAQLGLIARFLGVDPELLPLVGDDGVMIRSAHTAMGNPSRFSSGIVHLAADRQWESSMGVKDRVLATVPALPLMARYGYPVVRPASSAC